MHAAASRGVIWDAWYAAGAQHGEYAWGTYCVQLANGACGSAGRESQFAPNGAGRARGADVCWRRRRE